MAAATGATPPKAVPDRPPARGREDAAAGGSPHSPPDSDVGWRSLATTPRTDQPPQFVGLTMVLETTRHSLVSSVRTSIVSSGFRHAVQGRGGASPASTLRALTTPTPEPPAQGAVGGVIPMYAVRGDEAKLRRWQGRLHDQPTKGATLAA